MSLCFLAAFEAKQHGQITENEYFHYLFAHCTGVEHEEDETPEIGWKILETDPFGYSIYCWSRRIDLVKDATPFEDVFKAYRMGTIDDVKAKLNILGEEQAKFVRESLALLSLKERHSEVLKLCLTLNEFAYEGYFEDEANRVSEDHDPETFIVLEESEFRKKYPRRAPGTEEYDDDEDPSAVFDVGGSYPVEW